MVGVDGVPEPQTGWTFLTSHARVLASIADDHNARIRDIAARCRLTERAVQKIISELERDGYLSHIRKGRSNQYSIDPSKVLRHPAEAGLTVAALLSMLIRDEAERQGPTRSSGAGAVRNTASMRHAAGSEDDRSSQVGHSRSGPPEVVQYELHGTQVFAAHGEYDPASITLLAGALQSAAEKYPRVVVDTTAVVFADSTFLNLLLRVHHATDLRVVAPPPQLRRLLELTGADKVLKVRADLADATS